jgi:hypothetical protein
MRLATFFVLVGVGSVFAASFASPLVSYAACARCNSISSGVNMRGSSLAGVVGRKSGTTVDNRYQVAPPRQNGYLTVPLYRAARGCDFRTTVGPYGLLC